MNVVSNTSPLIFLSKIDALDLLALCFDSIAIPNAVDDELKEFTLPDFISRESISEFGSCFVQGAIGSLHAGELEAIVLAQEKKSDFVLLDDLSARNRAKRYGLQVMGTVGVLKLANTKGVASASQTGEYYDELIGKHGLYLSEKILSHLKNTLC